jgi:hypothetical protein
MMVPREEEVMCSDQQLSTMQSSLLGNRLHAHMLHGLLVERPFEAGCELYNLSSEITRGTSAEPSKHSRPYKELSHTPGSYKEGIISTGLRRCYNSVIIAIPD